MARRGEEPRRRPGRGSLELGGPLALHGVSELWSADRDFSRFPDLTVRNPIVG